MFPNLPSFHFSVLQLEHNILRVTKPDEPQSARDLQDKYSCYARYASNCLLTSESVYTFICCIVVNRVYVLVIPNC